MLEVNVKQPGGLLQDQLDAIESASLGAGVFNAIPDGPGDGQFYDKDGHCCYRLSDLFFSYGGGKDTADNRGDWDYLIKQGFKFITTDSPIALRAYLDSRNIP